ncbi:MAG: hypothetical protein ACI9SQ_000664, partial [Rubritalea sp.]
LELANLRGLIDDRQRARAWVRSAGAEQISV